MPIGTVRVGMVTDTVLGPEQESVHHVQPHHMHIWNEACILISW